VHILIEHADVRSPSAAEISKVMREILNGNPSGGNLSFHRGPGTYGSAFVKRWPIVLVPRQRSLPTLELKAVLSCPSTGIGGTSPAPI
jgi:hypothetical protein